MGANKVSCRAYGQFGGQEVVAELFRTGRAREEGGKEGGQEPEDGMTNTKIMPSSTMPEISSDGTIVYISCVYVEAYGVIQGKQLAAEIGGSVEGYSP